jgi:hypothetical protein
MVSTAMLRDPFEIETWHYKPFQQSYKSICQIKDNRLIHSMGQNPSWEANGFSTSQKLTSLLWNLMVHYFEDYCLLGLKLQCVVL